jgi:prophage tail gpP-like protein
MSSRVIVQAAPAGGGSFVPLIWKKIKIRKSLDEICHSLELELPADERSKIHKHDTVEVRYENQYISDSEENKKRRLVTTVKVDEVTNAADARRKSIVVIGRSPARDIIDSTWSFGIMGRQSLEAITKRIAGKFGIKVTRMPTDGPETGPVASFSFENESPWAKLLTEADNQGYVLTSNEAGGLYIWKAASEKRYEKDAGGGALFLLTEGRNIRSVRYTENGAEQFHEYIVQGGGRPPAQVIDPTCKNNRVLTINLTDFGVSEETLRRRALTEMLRRRENRAVVTVSGWGLGDGQIRALGDTYHKEIFWNPNFLIPVKLPSIGLDDNLLISEVEYEADPSVMNSTLTLVNQEAYV